MTDAATGVALARLRLAVDDLVRRVDALEAQGERLLAEQRAHRARMDAVFAQAERRLEAFAARHAPTNGKA